MLRSILLFAVLIMLAISAGTVLAHDTVTVNGAPLVIEGVAHDPSAVWQEDGDPPATVEYVVAQDVFDDVGNWARSTRDTAILLSVSVMAAVSTVKTVFWTFVPDDTEDRIKNWTINGLNLYSVALVGVVAIASWVMVSTRFDWNPWLNSPVPGIANLPSGMHTLMTSALVTTVAVIEHEIVTGLGPFIKSLVDWVKRLVRLSA